MVLYSTLSSRTSILGIEKILWKLCERKGTFWSPSDFMASSILLRLLLESAKSVPLLRAHSEMAWLPVVFKGVLKMLVFESRGIKGCGS